MENAPNGDQTLDGLKLSIIEPVPPGLRPPPSAPVGALLLVLALRDRRQDRLLGLIAPEVARLRGAVGLEVRCATLGPAARVILHTWLCAPEERWSLWLRCAQLVPPRVQGVTEAPLGPGLVGRLVVRRSPRGRLPAGRLAAAPLSRRGRRGGLEGARPPAGR